MTSLAVAVAGVGALSLVNLWLVIALARKLRSHEEQVARRPSGQRPVVGLPPGTQVPDFTLTTVAGDTVSATGLRGQRTVIGFFSPGCEPCHDQIPAFTAFAQTLPGGPDRALAVISGRLGGARGQGGDGAANDLARQLADVAHVVREPSAGTAAAALAVSGFPSFILLDADGRVEAGAHAIAGLVSLAGSALSA
jgi:thiol-disulfide isomerase/thioredoxin